MTTTQQHNEDFRLYQSTLTLATMRAETVRQLERIRETQAQYEVGLITIREATDILRSI